MDQTTLPAASGALPWRSQDHKTNPSSSSIQPAMPASFGPESGSHCGKSSEHSLWVDDGGGEQSLDRGPLRRRGPVSDVDLFGSRYFLRKHLESLPQRRQRSPFTMPCMNLEMPCRVQPPVCCPARNIGAHNPSTRIWDSTARHKLHQDI